MRPVIGAALLLLGYALPREGVAQRRDATLPALPGTRVRVHTIGPPPVVIAGTLAAKDSVGVSVDDPSHPPAVLVRWDEITFVEYEQRLTSGAAFRRGAKIGALITGGLGAVIMVAAIAQQNGDCSDCLASPIMFAVPAVVVLTGAGALVGGVLGSGNRTRWVQVRP